MISSKRTLSAVILLLGCITFSQASGGYLILAIAITAAAPALAQNYNPSGGYNPDQRRYGNFERQQLNNDLEQQRQRQQAVRQQLEREGYYSQRNQYIGPQRDDD